jgi:hypothetical protein
LAKGSPLPSEKGQPLRQTQKASQIRNERYPNSDENLPQALVFMTKLCHNNDEGDLKTFRFQAILFEGEVLSMPC